MLRGPGGHGGLRRRWLRHPFIHRSLHEPIDTSIFAERPRGRVAWGLLLVSVAGLMGVPLGSVMALLAFWLDAPALVALTAPVLYVASLPLFALGMCLSGPAAMGFADTVLRLSVRAIARRCAQRGEGPPDR